MISVWSCIPLLLIALHCLEERGRRAEMRLVTCYNGKDKSGQDGTIINVQWSRPDQQIWKTVKLSLLAAQLNNTLSVQNTIEIKILIFSLSLPIQYRLKVSSFLQKNFISNIKAHTFHCNSTPKYFSIIFWCNFHSLPCPPRNPPTPPPVSPSLQDIRVPVIPVWYKDNIKTGITLHTI